MSLIGPGSNTNDIYNEPISKEENFFTGAFNSDTLYFDPLITGYAFIIFTKLPFWVTKEYPNLEMLLQKNFQAFEGLNDIELTTSPATEGFSANEYHVAQSIAAKPSSFNLKHMEFSGSPIRNAYTHWVSGIRDPRTNIATYPKNYDCDYRAINHTGEMMYIVTRPDADNFAGKKIIEFACYWTAIMPKKIPIGHLNHSKATQTTPIEIDIPFSGIPHISEKVNDYAYDLMLSMEERGYDFENQGAYDPLVD